MRPLPQLIALSLAANAALLAALALRPTLAPPALRDFFSSLSPLSAPSPRLAASPSISQLSSSAKGSATAEALNAPLPLWSAFETDDIRTLAARLHAAGFPPSVIRSVIDARLGERFTARFLERQATAAATPYWKPASASYTPFGGNKFWDDYAELYRERSKQTREALSDDLLANSTDGEATAEQTRRYGNLSRAKIDLIERINADYEEMSSQVHASGQGVTLAEDREKYLMLQRERRADLAAALSPEEFADYQLRHSHTATGKRTALTLMNATEEEFRTIYRLQQAMEDQLAADPAAFASPNAYTVRTNSLQDDLAKDLRAALGDARFADFQRANTFDFQRLSAIAENHGLSSETTLRAYTLRDTLAQESNRIAADPTQTAEQKRDALRVLAQNTRAQLLTALGPAAQNAYLPYADRWIKPVESGQSLTFNSDGTPRFQPLPAPAR